MRPFVSWRTVFIFTHTHTYTLEHSTLRMCVCVPQQFAKISRLFILHFFGALIDVFLMVPKCCCQLGANASACFLSLSVSLPPLTHVHVLVAALVRTASQHTAAEEPGSHVVSRYRYRFRFNYKYQISIGKNLKFKLRACDTARDATLIVVSAFRLELTANASDASLGLVEDYDRALIN